MHRLTGAAALLAATFLAGPALAADPDLAGEVAAMRAELDSLRAEVAELRAREAERDAAPAPAPPAQPAVPTQAAAAPPSWKGAPEFEDKKTGFRFKPKALVQFDAGFVGTPGPDERPALWHSQMWLHVAPLSSE